MYRMNTAAENDTARPDVSVIIPVWNGERCIARCLDALAAQSLAPDRYEVIVVDNGSSDGTVAAVRARSGIKLLEEPEPGSYAARNRAIEVARGRYLAFTDADCVPERDWLEQALACAQGDPLVGVVAGRVAFFHEITGGSEICGDYEQLFNLNQENYARAGTCATANWTSPTNIVRRLQGFDASLKSGGDFEMASRIRAAGLSIRYCPTAVVRHPVRGRFGELVDKRRRTVGGKWAMQQGRISALGFAHGTMMTAIYQYRDIVRAEGMSLWRKTRVGVLVMVLTGSALLEQVRLMRGGAPRRS
jgi:glycosyltransferase involved in cell wall biosynthesis